MSEFAVLAGIGLALLLGAASPGPSFVLVSRMAIARSRRDGLFAAVGMGVGGFIFAMASFLGLSGFLLSVPSAYWVLKVAGGTYLIYLGVSAWLNSKNPVTDNAGEPTDERSVPLNSFLTSLATQLSNPKTLIVYTGVFATFLPANPEAYFGFVLCTMVFAIEFGWYAFVVLVLSTSAPRMLYLHYKKFIDRASGAVLGALGLKLIFSSEG